MHISAEVNFGTRKIALTLTNDSGMKEELSDLDFFSTNNITEIGSVYLRAAGASGTTCVDNLKVYQNAAPEYAIEIKAVDAADEEAVSNAEITVADSLGNPSMKHFQLRVNLS